MPKPASRMTSDRVNDRALSAIRKIDQLGPRGITLCSMEEIEAMALVIVANVRLADLEPRSTKKDQSP